MAMVCSAPDSRGINQMLDRVSGLAYPALTPPRLPGKGGFLDYGLDSRILAGLSLKLQDSLFILKAREIIEQF